ncbi:MAG: 30S ribosomal protein S19 [Kiritimatiellaeota bacterium]|nr:30S ribosomal protein S19 [Kiritimatiellota bacterium]
MARSIKKGPYVEEKLLQRIGVIIRSGDKRPLKTWSRRSMVLPEFIGLNIAVHNGKTFINLYITENMVGHRLGEFSPTRTFRKHGVATDKVVALK